MSDHLRFWLQDAFLVLGALFYVPLIVLLVGLVIVILKEGAP